MEDNKKKKVIIGAAIGAVVLVAVIVVLLLNKDRIKASTMRLLRIVGEVTLEDGKKKKTIIDNLRLADGNALSTGSESLASVGLDDTKIISLEENSRAEFYQKGKKLELILTKGRLFFDVQAPLADNESLDIKSSTMVVGIRGTSGYVWEDPAKNIQYIFITDGHTKITGYNPETKQTEEITLGPGQRATAYMYDNGTFNTFQVDDITEDDLPIALIRELNNNPQTWERVLKATGYDENKLLKRLEEEIYDSSYISIEKIELPDAEPEPEPEPKKEETKVESEPEPEPEPEPEQAPEPVNTVASVESAPTVQTPTSVVESEPESESEPEQSNEEPPAEQPAQQIAEQPAQQPAQQTNPTDPNSGTNTNTSTNNPNGNSLNVAPQTIDENSEPWTLTGITDGTNTWDLNIKLDAHNIYDFAEMSMGNYNGQEDMVRATIHSSDTLPPSSGMFTMGYLDIKQSTDAQNTYPLLSKGNLLYTGEDTYTADVVSLDVLKANPMSSADLNITVLYSNDSEVSMSNGDSAVSSFDSVVNSGETTTINIQNDTALNGSVAVTISALPLDPSGSSDYAGYKFSVETYTSNYAAGSLRSIKLWLNDDTANTKTLSLSGTDDYPMTYYTTHTAEVISIENLFSTQTISNYDVLHYQVVTD